MALRDYLQGEIAQDFADGMLSRRDALRRLVMLGMTAPAAATLIAACGDDGANTAPRTTSSPSTSAAGSAAPSTTASSTTASSTTASSTTAGGATAVAELIRFKGSTGELQGAWASAAKPKGSVLVIHENRGLQPHFFALAGRFARDGYAALAIDLVSPEGGTASMSEAQAQAALGAAPAERLLADLRAGLDELARRNAGLKLGVIGFCFGGGMTWSLLDAGEARLAAAAPFYGPGPAAPDFRKTKAAVLGVYAELDSRVNASRPVVEQALKAAGLTYEIRTFAGADHAFFNDTGTRYNQQAATQAYAAVLDWFGRYLV